MRSVFLSHSARDRRRLQPLVDAIRRAGIRLWWSHDIDHGAHWRRDVMRALRAAPLVVVAWTEASVESDWVLEEAEHGRKRGILLPLKLDDVDVPIPFGAIQTVDLTGFPREAVTRLITELEARAPEAVAPRAEAPGRARGPNNLPFHLANAAMALATVFLLIQIWRIANP